MIRNTRFFSLKVHSILPTTSSVNKAYYTTKMAVKYLKKNEDKMLKHLFDGGKWNVYDTKLTNLCVGAPGPDILVNCCNMFEKATSHRMKKEIETQGLMFQYGPAVGPVELRSEIAKYLTNAYKNEVKSEDLIITTGATQGLHLILSSLLDLNGYIFVEDVTYMIALEVFKEFHTVKVIPVKLNEDGVDIESLRTLLKEKQFESKVEKYWGLYYTIPTYHNPTGIAFSEDVMKNIIRLAREFDILVVCDDVYNTLNYGQNEPHKRLYAYDDPKDEDFKGNVISNGSFSKIIGPGVRVGWLEAPPRCKSVLEKNGFLQSGGGLNTYTSSIMTSLFELKLAQGHAQMVKELYQDRMMAVCEVLDKYLPNYCKFIAPQGGYFIWIEMPEYSNAEDFLDMCVEAYKVCFIPGNVFSINKKYKNCFRISIAFHSKTVLEKAVEKICTALKMYSELE